MENIHFTVSQGHHPPFARRYLKAFSSHINIMPLYIILAQPVDRFNDKNVKIYRF
jgi:hypothetical protein